MKKALAVLLFIAAPLAFAHNCPNVMKEIDAKMSTAGKNMDGAKMAKIKQLRVDGEKLHKAGKHDESLKTLNEAKQMLNG